jgi:uncharacterized protein YggE
MRLHFLAAVALAGALSAQSLAGPPAIRATGEGVVYARPDQAKIDIGVVTQAPTAEAAGSQNAAQLQGVMTKLRALLGQKADIRTISYSLNPAYRYPQNGGKPSIEGYTAMNTVEVTTDDLPNVGKLIDAATAGGANQIQRLQFTLRDETSARREALAKAALQSRSNAEAMAAAVGLKLGKVLLLEQGSPQIIRPMVGAMAAAGRIGGAPTPVEAEPIEVRASVTLTIAVE